MEEERGVLGMAGTSTSNTNQEYLDVLHEFDFDTHESSSWFASIEDEKWTTVHTTGWYLEGNKLAFDGYLLFLMSDVGDKSEAYSIKIRGPEHLRNTLMSVIPPEQYNVLQRSKMAANNQ